MCGGLQNLAELRQSDIAAGDDRDFYVYTPPGYDHASSQLYPLLYLLHGHNGTSSDALAWTGLGGAPTSFSIT